MCFVIPDQSVQPKYMMSVIEKVVLLYKALVRTHLDYACCIWSPCKQKYKDALENVQRRATKQINGMSDICPIQTD